VVLRPIHAFYAAGEQPAASWRRVSGIPDRSLPTPSLLLMPAGHPSLPRFFHQLKSAASSSSILPLGCGYNLGPFGLMDSSQPLGKIWYGGLCRFSLLYLSWPPFVLIGICLGHPSLDRPLSHSPRIPHSPPTWTLVV